MIPKKGRKNQFYAYALAHTCLKLSISLSGKLVELSVIELCVNNARRKNSSKAKLTYIAEMSPMWGAVQFSENRIPNRIHDWPQKVDSEYRLWLIGRSTNQFLKITLLQQPWQAIATAPHGKYQQTINISGCKSYSIKLMSVVNWLLWFATFWYRFSFHFRLLLFQCSRIESLEALIYWLCACIFRTLTVKYCEFWRFVLIGTGR